jgi:predicted dienelactone hydrolase
MTRRAVFILLCAVLLTTTAPTAANAAAPPRTYPVASTTFTFIDTTRPTPPNRTYPGAPTRTLPTLVLYPDLRSGRPAHFPLIVFSHGFTASGPAYAPLLEKWAARGFVVAAPTFPLSNGRAPGGPTIADYVNQPGDVSFVITQLLRVNKDGRSALHGEIDHGRIGVAGHSLGAITTLGVAYNSCCQDPRIDAAVPISGLALPFGNGTFFTGPAVPLLLIHGTDDHTVPYQGSVNAFEQAAPPKYFMTLIGAPHTPFFGPWGPPIDDTVVAFFDKYLRHRGGDADIERAANVPGIASLQLVDRAPALAPSG